MVVAHEAMAGLAPGYEDLTVTGLLSKLSSEMGLSSYATAPSGPEDEVEEDRELAELDPVRAALATTPEGVTTLDLGRYIRKLSQMQVLQLAGALETHVSGLLLREWRPLDLGILRTLTLHLGSRLLTLDLSDTDLTDVHLHAIVPQLAVLRTLKLRKCALLTSAGIRALVQACHNTLTFLDLSECKRVTSDCLMWLGGALAHNSPRCALLRTLDISGCRQVGDEGLVGLGQGCRALRDVNLSGCSRATGRGVAALVQQLRGLRVLAARDCPLVGDRALLASGQHCHKLRSLNVGRCGPITDRGLAALGGGCPGLQALNLAGAKAVSEDGLCKLVTGARGMQVRA
jgi:hypothetical protein